MKDRFSQSDVIRLFGMANQLVETDLDRVEQELGVTLGRSAAVSEDKDDAYYPQFDKSLRGEAAVMAHHYEVFYTLEKTIRAFVADALEGIDGPKWWFGPRVPDKIQSDVSERTKREVDSGFTLRSSDPLDYTTFGELGEIIKTNWDVFGSMLNSQKAVERILSNLNMLRGPIAHCSAFAEDEVLRLRLTVRDWFRQIAAP